MLDFIITFLAAALAGTGIGGGGLYMIYLTLIKNIPQLQAQGINLAFFIVSGGTSLLFHLGKRKINLPLTLLIAAVGISGSLLGSALAAKISPAFLSKIFGAFLIFCGVKSFFRKKIGLTK